MTLAARGEVSPDGLGKPGGVSGVVVADDASPDGIGKPSGITSVEDGAGTDPSPQICHPTIASCGA